MSDSDAATTTSSLPPPPSSAALAPTATTTATATATATAPVTASTDEPLVQYIVVRRDLLTSLHWPTGSVVSQAAHASVAVLFSHRDDDSVRRYVDDTPGAPEHNGLSAMDRMHKVVMECKNESQLLKQSDVLTAAGVVHRVWIEQPENVRTCLATLPYPRSFVRPLFKKCQLFK